MTGLNPSDGGVVHSLLYRADDYSLAEVAEETMRDAPDAVSWSISGPHESDALPIPMWDVEAVVEGGAA